MIQTKTANANLVPRTLAPSKLIFGENAGDQSTEVAETVAAGFAVGPDAKSEAVVENINFVHSLTRVVCHDLKFRDGVSEMSLKSLLSIWDNAESALGRITKQSTYVRVGAARLMVLALFDAETYMSGGHIFSMSLEMLDNRFLSGTAVSRQVVQLAGAVDIWFTMNHSVAIADANHYFFRISVLRNGKPFQPLKADATVAQVIFVPLLKITGMAEVFAATAIKPVVLPLAKEDITASATLVKSAALNTRKFIQSGAYATMVTRANAGTHLKVFLPHGDPLDFEVTAESNVKSLKRFLYNRGFRDFYITVDGVELVGNPRLADYMSSMIEVCVRKPTEGKVYVRGVPKIHSLKVLSNSTSTDFLKLCGLEPADHYLVCEGKVINNLFGCFDRTVEVRVRVRGGSPRNSYIHSPQKLKVTASRLVGFWSTSSGSPVSPGWGFGRRVVLETETCGDSYETYSAVMKGLDMTLGTLGPQNGPGLLEVKTPEGTKFCKVGPSDSIDVVSARLGYNPHYTYGVCEGKIVRNPYDCLGRSVELRVRTLGGGSGSSISPSDSVSNASYRTAHSSLCSTSSSKAKRCVKCDASKSLLNLRDVPKPIVNFAVHFYESRSVTYDERGRVLSESFVREVRRM